MAKILFIDTSNNKKTEVGVEIDGKRKDIFSESATSRSESVIPLIDKLLKENNIEIKEVSEVKVNNVAGSFTGIRVGVGIANALSYLLKIPVNSKNLGELEKPVYNN